MRYTNLEDYILKNMNGLYGEFTLAITDCSEKSPNTVLVSIIPTHSNAKSAEFYIHANNKIEFRG